MVNLRYFFYQMIERLKSLFRPPTKDTDALMPVTEKVDPTSQKDIRIYGIFLVLSTLPVHLKLLLATPGLTYLSPESVGVSLVFISGLLALVASFWGRYYRMDNLLWAYSTVILAVFAGVKNYRNRITTEFTGYRDPEERTALCTLCVVLGLVAPATAVAANLIIGDARGDATGLWLRYVTRLNVWLTFPLVSFVCVYYQLQPPLYCAIICLPALTSLLRYPKIRLIVFFIVAFADVKFLGEFSSAFLSTFPVMYSLMPAEYLSTLDIPRVIRYLPSECLPLVGGIFWSYLSHESTFIVWSCGYLLSYILWVPFGTAYTYFVARGKGDNSVARDGNEKEKGSRSAKREGPAILYSPNARGGIQGLGGGPVVYADDDGDTAHDFYEANDKGELQKLPRSKLHRCDAKNEIY